ncbi:microcystin-dependent protein [Caulobacter ginsengisoli]|uniref:Microcystin-dependent protein n=1 Tax=Caulobacter ginsengisoli TaxID=400775 RepID=A0ABU0IY66_9CAUL|nr:microcystin-dependent protein [Caulobacter ginsengisoli]
MPINQNQGLFSILGTTYGGDGRVNFALPDFRSRVPVHAGGDIDLGGRYGAESHVLTPGEMAAHTHTLMASKVPVAATAANATPAPNKVLAPGIAALQGGGTQDVNIYGNGAPSATLIPASSSSLGGGQPHENRQPFLALNFIIAIRGNLIGP